jgi:Predicted amidohydrolase
MKIELVQGFQILFEKAKNIEFLMERMEKSNADLLIFGELFLTGYSAMNNMHELAERRDSVAIREIGEKARETRKT